MEENIRIGDSATALQELDSKQEQRTRRAADLGGATEFVSKLPRGFKTNLGGANKLSEMSGPDAHHILTAVTSAKGNLIAENKPTPLSGGQKQRLALLSCLKHLAALYLPNKQN
jgi:ABC-type multidrug transport system fused ATPase/permease subunit